MNPVFSSLVKKRQSLAKTTAGTTPDTQQIAANSVQASAQSKAATLASKIQNMKQKSSANFGAASVANPSASMGNLSQGSGTVSVPHVSAASSQPVADPAKIAAAMSTKTGGASTAVAPTTAQGQMIRTAQANDQATRAANTASAMGNYSSGSFGVTPQRNPATIQAPVEQTSQQKLVSNYAARARREQAMNLNAAGTQAGEAIAGSGLDVGSAAAQRLRDRANASANAANIEVGNNLADQERDLRTEDRANRQQDLSTAAQLFKNNPALLQKLGLSAFGTDSSVGQALKGVTDENGNLLEQYNTSASGAEYDQWVERYKQQGMSDADAKAAALKVMENTTAALTAGVAESANAATEEAKNKAALSGATAVSATLGGDLRGNTSATSSLESAINSGSPVNIGGKAYSNVGIRFDGANGRKLTFSYTGKDVNGNEVVLGTNWAYSPSGNALVAYNNWLKQNTGMDYAQITAQANDGARAQFMNLNRTAGGL